MKHKKSLLLLKTGVWLIAGIILFFVVIKGCDKITSALYNKETIYQIYFEDFVNGLNDMGSKKPIDKYTVKMNKKMAIIGFNRDTNSWNFMNNGVLVSTIDKPAEDLACATTACVCLCRDGIKRNQVVPEIIDCNGIYCLPLQTDTTQKDITPRTNVLDENNYWEYGFLFVRDMEGINGLSKYPGEEMELFVDLTGGTDGTIAVCNNEMLTYNQGILIEGCFNPPLP